MNKVDLLQLIEAGESSTLEFKRDDCRPEQIAREAVAMANSLGGVIILGIEDDRTTSGLARKNTEEWVMDSVFGRKIHPVLIPHYQEFDLQGGRVAALIVPQGTTKPYVVRHNEREDIYVRIGSTTRLATREQQARLFTSGGMLHTELLPVSGATINTFDLQRVQDYLANFVGEMNIPQSADEWERRLCDFGLMVETDYGIRLGTIAGVVLFAHRPRRLLPQAGIRLMVFEGDELDYSAKVDYYIDEPAIGRWLVSTNGVRENIANGLLESFAAIVRPHIFREETAINIGLRKDTKALYPWQALRELVVNALAHRDWTRLDEITITIFSDRLEVFSPGALVNSMTVEKMKAGLRNTRNPVIADILRDYGYADRRGMGVRKKVLPPYNNTTQPTFEATEDHLRVVLPRLE
ncbi:MAG: RNA-binding domain-containing protein [Bacillota bacterium]